MQTNERIASTRDEMTFGPLDLHEKQEHGFQQRSIFSVAAARLVRTRIGLRTDVDDGKFAFSEIQLAGSLPPKGPPAAPPKGPPAAPPKGPPAAPPKGPPAVPPKGPPAVPPKGPPAVPPKGPPTAPPKGPPAAPPTKS
jgi:hypothetical protein